MFCFTFLSYFLFVLVDAKADPVFVQDVSEIWRLLLAEGISIAAFTEIPMVGNL